MKYLKQFGISLLYIIGITLIGSFIITIFHYFNIFSDKLTNIVLLMIAVISMIIGGFKLGKTSHKKGWIEGLKLGLFVTILFILFGILGIRYNYKLSDFIYYLIFITSTIFGSILGINKKKKN